MLEPTLIGILQHMIQYIKCGSISLFGLIFEKHPTVMVHQAGYGCKLSRVVDGTQELHLCATFY